MVKTIQLETVDLCISDTHTVWVQGVDGMVRQRDDRNAVLPDFHCGRGSHDSCVNTNRDMTRRNKSTISPCAAAAVTWPAAELAACSQLPVLSLVTHGGRKVLACAVEMYRLRTSHSAIVHRERRWCIRPVSLITPQDSTLSPSEWLLYAYAPLRSMFFLTVICYEDAAVKASSIARPA